MQLAIYFAILALLSTLNFGCKKSDIEEPDYNQKQKLYSVSYINNTLPVLTPKKKLRSVKDFTELSLNNLTNSTKSNENLPIISARWLIETTVNTNYANLYDSTLYDFSKATLDVSLAIVGFNPSGEPLVNSDEITEKYNFIKNEIEIINGTENNTFYLASVQLTEIENSTIHLRVILSKAKKNQNSYKSYIPYPHLPWVLAPNQTPIPFNPSDNYPPIPPDCTSSNSTMLPNWAGYYITEKLMVNRGRLDIPTGEYIIEMCYPFQINGYMDYNLLPPPEHDLYWHSINNLSNLNSTQLNTYLTNYKGQLDLMNPYGYNNIYASEVYVSPTNTYQNWDPPSSYEGAVPDGVHYFHGIIVWYVRFVYVGLPS